MRVGRAGSAMTPVFDVPTMGRIGVDVVVKQDPRGVLACADAMPDASEAEALPEEAVDA
jgi:hypothetical protein